MLLTSLRNILLLVFLLVICFSSINAAQKNNEKKSVKHGHVSLEVISSVNSIAKEKNLHLGLFFKLDPGWKIYWKYPGKAGYPPDIDWTKSKNIENLEILWPKPEKFKILGMESIGYSKEVILPIKLTLKEINEELIANFDVDYLTCKKICVPFNDNLILNIPVGNGHTSEYENIINKYIDQSNYSNYSNILTPEGILFFSLIAFFGGVILNFMPCVFPVLSLKIYNVLSQLQNASYKSIKRNLFATILGITFSFFVLSLFTIFLKNLGHTLGWGFQFQSPFFLAFMILILILFSLNLIDVFFVDIPGFFKKHLNKFINFNKKSSEFFQNFLLGSFVTILSTPCSAPFIGTALGFALISPNQIIFLIFFCISLGLASPYIILATKPQILSFLPKPGLWMKKLKYFLSFLLILTAIWLLSILLIQINTISNNSKNDWLDFNHSKLNELVAEGKNVIFVDITADWCMTCFFNKKTVIDRKKVKDIFKKYDVKKMQGDLTTPNKKINEYINSFGRFGIPVNVIYSPSAPQGLLLSEVLTVKGLLSTFDHIKND